MKTGLNRGLGNSYRAYYPTTLADKILAVVTSTGTSLEQIQDRLSEKYAVKPDRVLSFNRSIKSQLYGLCRERRIERVGPKYSREIIYKTK